MTTLLSGAADDAAAARRTVVVAIAMMLVAGITSSFMHIGVRLVSPSLPVMEIVCLRALVSLLVTLPFMLQPGTTALRANAPGLLILRGVIGVCSISTWYYALAHMPLADAGAISFTTALFVTIGAALYFREPVGLSRWSAVIAGLIGALIVMRPGSGVFSWVAVVAVLSSMLWATILLLAKEIGRYDSSLTISFYQPTAVAAFAVLPAIPVWVWPDFHTWLIVVMMGAFGAVGNYCYIRALKLADASVVIPVDYVRLLWMVSWGYWLFAEVPQATTWLGAALIIGSTLYITWRESSEAGHKQSERG